MLKNNRCIKMFIEHKLVCLKKGTFKLDTICIYVYNMYVQVCVYQRIKVPM